MTTVSVKPAASASIYHLGMSLGVFLTVSFALCVAFGLLVPGAHMYQSWLPLLPGVTWMSLPSFLLGLVESFAYGWYIALVFVPIYNFFAPRAKQ
ncbi:MAG: DUF5676 family membrane protein [Robiginitomaculum sp.]|nr:DUF5676 family membrane protein [Robiginitomaculum sp.]